MRPESAADRYSRQDLLCIGLLGAVQNLHAAGASRKPSAMGVHIKHVETTSSKRVATMRKGDRGEISHGWNLASPHLLPRRSTREGGRLWILAEGVEVPVGT